MDKVTRECLEGFKDLFDSFSNYSRLYDCYGTVFPFTNEYIKGYLDLLDFSSKKTALSVLSSGDHPFNLISKGITDVDTFDINKLTEFYALGLKRAMIMKYSYQEFIDICEKLSMQINNEPGNVTLEDVVFDLTGDMDEKYRDYWIGVLDHIYKYRKMEWSAPAYIFTGGVGLFNLYNNYLKDEKTYNAFKEQLSRANITFTPLDIKSLPSFYEDRRYDIVLLSNILDYAVNNYNDKWSLMNLKRFVGQMEAICNDDADIVLQYLYLFSRVDSRDDARISVNSYINYGDLRGFELKKFEGPIKCTDGGIVLRKVRK